MGLNEGTNVMLTDDRIRVLMVHYEGNLPPDHPLYSECYKQAETDTVAALKELIEHRLVAKLNQRYGLKPRSDPDSVLLEQLEQK